MKASFILLSPSGVVLARHPSLSVISALAIRLASLFPDAAFTISGGPIIL